MKVRRVDVLIRKERNKPLASLQPNILRWSSSPRLVAGCCVQHHKEGMNGPLCDVTDVASR